MPRLALVFICLSAIVPSVSFASPARPSAASPGIRSAIVAAVERDRARFGGRTPVPGAVIGVWDANGAGFVRAFGYADLAKKRPLTAADHFRIGSNTKTFVVSVILQLIGEKKFTLDTPLSHFALGVNVPNANAITVRELCNMRSGLFEGFDTPQFARLGGVVPKNFSPRMLVAWAAKQKPYFAPGKGYHYSNTNYMLLGLIIENVTKDTVGNQIAKRLLRPLGLTQTSFPATEAMPNPWAHGYALDAHGNWSDISNTIPVAFMWAAGEMISDMHDMRRWIKMYATAKTGGPPGYRALSECKPFLGNTSFGLGINCSAGWYGYTGALAGYNTADFYNPSTGTTIIAWLPYYGEKPPETPASVFVRDIARIITPDNVPFVYTPAQLQQSGL